MGLPIGTVVKNSPANTGDTRDAGLILGLGNGGGNGNPLQYPCLEAFMDREAWRITVHRVTKSQTQLFDRAHTSYETEDSSLKGSFGLKTPY